MNNLYERYLSDNAYIQIKEGTVIIPDISGYTAFVNRTCIEAGRYITRELLSAILLANEIGLEISEIEGDVILFYKFGPKPSVTTILGQYETMLHRFNSKLEEIEAVIGHKLNLSLKMIAHYGTFTEYTIGTFKKLYGEPIVKAHALLKNDEKSGTYVLMTDSLATMQGANKDYFLVDYHSEKFLTRRSIPNNEIGYGKGIMEIGIPPRCA